MNTEKQKIYILQDVYTGEIYAFSTKEKRALAIEEIKNKIKGKFPSETYKFGIDYYLDQIYINE